MNGSGWERFLYTDEEIHALCVLSDGFTDDVNKNCRVRDEDESFSVFVDKGSTALIQEHPLLVKQLL